MEATFGHWQRESIHGDPFFYIASSRPEIDQRNRIPDIVCTRQIDWKSGRFYRGNHLLQSHEKKEHALPMLSLSRALRLFSSLTKNYALDVNSTVLDGSIFGIKVNEYSCYRKYAVLQSSYKCKYLRNKYNLCFVIWYSADTIQYVMRDIFDVLYDTYSVWYRLLDIFDMLCLVNYVIYISCMRLYILNGDSELPLLLMPQSK